MKSLFAKCLAAVSLSAVSVLASDLANAAELKVVAAEVVESAVKELAAKFEKSTGNKLSMEYGFAADQVKRVQAGEAVDVVIFPNGLINQPATQAVLAPGSTAAILHIGQGVAVKKGAPKPDISSAEALKQTLLKAKSVTFVPTGQSGVDTLKMFDKLGITNEMKAKIKAAKVEDVTSNVGKGEAELALFLNNYLIGNSQVDYVGPYPGDLQSFIRFSAAVGAKATDAAAAKAFVAVLAAPDAAPVIKAHGMDAH